MSVKRMRVFAGPNGSGKTTIFKSLFKGEKIELGTYVNADDLEKQLRERKAISFNDYQINVTNEELKDFFHFSTFSPVKRNDSQLSEKVKVKENFLYAETFIDSYIAADIAEFIRQQLLITGISFTYETVMSHESKIDFFSKARKRDYRVYLYYIATEDPEINSSRVNVRVAQQGHAVAPEIITSRYYRSLQNLKAAVKQTNRAYIFDNSGKQANLIAEITDGADVSINDALEIPNWVKTYL